MAIKHVVTYGFGFADGVKFIPTLGFTPGEGVTIVAGPYYLGSGQIYVSGIAIGQTYQSGQSQGQIYVSGVKIGKISSG